MSVSVVTRAPQYVLKARWQDLLYLKSEKNGAVKGSDLHVARQVPLCVPCVHACCKIYFSGP